MRVAAPLHYAPLPPGYRLRSVFRIILGVAIAVALIATIYYWPLIKAMGVKDYWERQCLNYQAAPGTIFYSNDPKDLPSLSTAAGYETSWQAWPADKFAVLPNRPLEKLSNRRVLPALFVHGRNAPSGPQRLVVVQMGRLANDPHNCITLVPVNLQPTFTRAPTSPIGHLEMFLKSTDVVRLYCGQPDPNDAAHFTIDYDLNNARGTIDGKLTSGGTITLSPRSGRVVLLSGTSFWSPGGAPLPPAVEEELARSSTTRPTR